MLYIFFTPPSFVLGGKTKQTPPPPLHRYITALVQTIVVSFLLDAYRYVTGRCVYRPGISWAVCLVGKLYSAMSTMRTRIYGKIFFLFTRGCVLGGFFFWELRKKRVAWTKDREREADLARKLCRMADNRFYESQILLCSQMILSVVVIRYFTEVCKLFSGHRFVMLAFYHFNE
jgi:hypothetical protein